MLIGEAEPRAGWRIRSRWLAGGGVAILAFLLAVGLQYLAGAFVTPFDQDGASHYISGAMIHDYLVAGRLSNPVRYLVAYHAHYPLVGIGHWPPLFYAVEAAWMLAFSSSRVAMLLLCAGVTAATAVLTGLCTGRQSGRLAGVLAGLAFVISPLVQSGTDTLMLDGAVALLCLLALMAYAGFLRSHGFWPAAAFGLVAVAALMVKGNAGCLVLLPPFAVLIGRRFALLRRPAFWLPVPIVAILAGPWYFATSWLAAAGFRYHFGWDYIRVAAPANMLYLLGALGPVILVVALIGFVRVCATGRAGASRPAHPVPICAAALVAAVFTFQLIVPVALQDRYMMPALPALLILAGGEIACWCDWAARHREGSAVAWRAVGFTVLLLSLLPFAAPVATAGDDGMTEAARQIWADRQPGNPAVLIVADATGEAEAIAELAMQDPRRPSLFAVRGSRLLGGGGYNNQDYRPRFADAADVMAAIDRYRIPFVLVRQPGLPSDWGHLRQVEEARLLDPSRWQLVYEDTGHKPAIRLFRIRGNDGETADQAALMALSGPQSIGAP